MTLRLSAQLIGAAWSALQTWRASETVRDQDRGPFYNTGAGLRYR